MSAATASRIPRGFGTEYTENYCWDKTTATAAEKDGRKNGEPRPAMAINSQIPQITMGAFPGDLEPRRVPPSRDPEEFRSAKYPSIYRETVIHKDDRGKYIDPFNNIATKPYGRRLMYDDTHRDKIYSSQWSSELADEAGCYSFPTTTGLDPEIPWCKDLQWKSQGEVGRWPTEQWKEWTRVARCPTYDGYDDQVEYSKYKTQIFRR